MYIESISQKPAHNRNQLLHVIKGFLTFVYLLDFQILLVADALDRYYSYCYDKVHCSGNFMYI